MKTNEIIEALRLCAIDDNDVCRGCPLDHAHPHDVECAREIKTAAADEIEKLTDRCARYAEEIAALQERARWISLAATARGAGGGSVKKPLLCRLGLHKLSKTEYVTITRRHKNSHGGKYRTNYAACERCGKLCYRVRLRKEVE